MVLIKKGKQQEKKKYNNNNSSQSSSSSSGGGKKGFSSQENVLLFRQYKTNKTIDLRNRLAINNRPLVTYIVTKYYNSNSITKEIREEILQEGIIGLMSAIDGYDCDLGFKFSSFASWWIRQAVNNYLINVNPIIRVPSHIRTAQNKLRKQLNLQEKNLDDLTSLDPSTFDLSKKMMNSIGSAMRSKQVISLQRPASLNNNKKNNKGASSLFGGGGGTMEELIPTNEELTSGEHKIDRNIMVNTVAEALKALPDKRRLILLLRYDIINEKEIKTKNKKIKKKEREEKK